MGGLITGNHPGGHSLVSSVPMRDQKNDEKRVLFFQEGQCAALTSFRVGKCRFCGKRVCFLQFC